MHQQRPNPWLNGAPPGFQNQGGGGGNLMGGHSQGMMGNQYNNPQAQLFNQLALAQNLLSSAFNNNNNQGSSNMLRNTGDGLLGNAPSHLHMMGNMNDVKRMRMNMDNRGSGPYRAQFQNRHQQRGGNASANSGNNRRDRERFKDNRQQQQQQQGRNRKESDQSRTQDKPKEKKQAEPETAELDKTYDPSSPTSDMVDKMAEAEVKEDTVEKAPSEGSKEAASKTLQVTIQRGQGGRSVSKEGKQFKKHMNSQPHAQKMEAFVAIHNAKTKEIEAAQAATEKRAARETSTKRAYCVVCKTHYNDSHVSHRRTKEHKKAKDYMYPTCRKCHIRNFKSRADFEKHCKTTAHKQACEEWARTRKESDKTDEDDKTEDSDVSEGSSNAGPDKEVDIIPEYNPAKQAGQSYVVPLSGYFCKLCRRFYKNEDAVQEHCRTRAHYDMYKKIVAKDGVTKTDAENKDGKISPPEFKDNENEEYGIKKEIKREVEDDNGEDQTTETTDYKDGDDDCCDNSNDIDYNDDDDN